MRHVDIFFIILYLFFSYSFLKRLYHPLYHRQSYDRLSPSSQHHVWPHPPIFSCLLHILLLFVRTISPINWVGTMLYSTSIWVLFSLSHQLSKSWYRLSTAAIKHLGCYRQQLPSLTTKSNHWFGFYFPLVNYSLKSWYRLHCSHQVLWLILPATSWSYH